jgi:glycosyltransferase involved in cell wall biosynthesis
MKISIVTPSFNQAVFIERTVQSVISQQGDFALEYLVMDGGSSDGTVDILRRHEARLTWVSEPDRGQSDAINKGLRMATGDVVAWLNSDDAYRPDALSRVAAEYRREPFSWCFGNCRIIDENDTEIRRVITRYKVAQSRAYSYRRLLRRDFVPQPSTFFSRKAYEEIGPIDEALTYSMDYDYWLRLGKRYDPRYIDRFLADFRWHGQSKNGRAYRAAAWETYLTCRRHASPEDRWDVLLHRLHYHILSVLYLFL